MTLAEQQFAGVTAVTGWIGHSFGNPTVNMNNWYAFSTNTHDVDWVCHFVRRSIRFPAQTWGHIGLRR